MAAGTTAAIVLVDARAGANKAPASLNVTKGDTQQGLFENAAPLGPLFARNGEKAKSRNRFESPRVAVPAEIVQKKDTSGGREKEPGRLRLHSRHKVVPETRGKIETSGEIVSVFATSHS